MRIARPTPTTHAPKTTVKSVRNAMGKPESGVSMTSTPRIMSVLERDIENSVSGLNNNHKFSTDMVWMAREIGCHFSRRTRYELLVHLGELASNSDF